MNSVGWMVALYRGMKWTLFCLLFLFPALTIPLGVARSRAAESGRVISPEIVSFTATPRVVSPGESATLAWKTRGVASVALEWGPEYHPRGRMQKRTGLDPSGTMTVQPREDTVYVLECETDAGEMCMLASATVRMK
jgi:hypothetical protein